MEQQIIGLIARDRLEIPLSSMYQKVRKTKGAMAKGLAALVANLEGAEFEGQRTYAHLDSEDKDRARGMKEAVAEFCDEFPKYGTILAGKINEKRAIAEQHLYFGVNNGCRLRTEDYISVMKELGLSESTARNLYPELLNVSRKLANAREEERSILVGKYSKDGKTVEED